MKKRVDVSLLLGVLLLGGGLGALAMAVFLLRLYAVRDDGIALVGGIVWGIGALAVLVLGWTLVRPAPVGDAEAERRLDRRRVWAGLVIGMCFLPASFLTVTPRHVDHVDVGRARCPNNLRQMATILSERARTKGWPPHGGKAFVLSLVADGVIDESERKNLEIFFCPACGIPDFEREMQHAYGSLTPENLHWKYLHALTAYAGRRNDEAAYRLQPEHVSDGAEPILACLCHPRSALVAFADGSARLLDREQLGLGADDPIVVGEESKSPILRKLSFD